MQISHNFTYITSLPSPTPPLCVISEPQAGLPVLYSNFSPAIYFTILERGNFSQHLRWFHVVFCFVLFFLMPGSFIHGFLKNTGVGCHSLHQGIFTTQRSNLGLLHCRQILHHLCHQGNFNKHRSHILHDALLITKLFHRYSFLEASLQISELLSSVYDGDKQGWQKPGDLPKWLRAADSQIWAHLLVWHDAYGAPALTRRVMFVGLLTRSSTVSWILTLIKRICEFYCTNRNIKIYFGRKKSQYIFLILKDIPIISFFNCELILRQNRKSDFFFFLMLSSLLKLFIPMFYSSFSYLGFHFPNLTACTLRKGLCITGSKNRGICITSTFTGLLRPRTFSVYCLSYLPRPPLDSSHL